MRKKRIGFLNRTILTMFQYWEPLRKRKKKGVGVQRDEEEEERNIKIRIKGKYVFSYMRFFNKVCREIEGV